MRAAAVVEAIGRIERDGDVRHRVHDTTGPKSTFTNLSVPGVVIQYTYIDDGSAFTVDRVRPMMLG